MQVESRIKALNVNTYLDRGADRKERHSGCA
jgi:hypothetical protein